MAGARQKGPPDHFPVQGSKGDLRELLGKARYGHFASDQSVFRPFYAGQYRMHRLCPFHWGYGLRVLCLRLVPSVFPLLPNASSDLDGLGRNVLRPSRACRPGSQKRPVAAFEPPDGAITRPDDRGPFLPLPVVTIETEAMVWSKADPWPSLDRQPSRGKSRPGWFKTRLSCPLVRKSKF
jgi:hypothetical protein